MDNKPSLSQYFGSSDVPPASQFFDEIGAPPSDMIQSIYLGDSEVPVPRPSTSNAEAALSTGLSFPNDILALANSDELVPFDNHLLINSLPRPSSFFNTMGPETRIGYTKSVLAPPFPSHVMETVMEDLDQPADNIAERRRNAWIPNEQAMKTLMKIQASPKGSYFPEREALTMPGIVLEEELPDALQAVVVEYLGYSMGRRIGIRGDNASSDEIGIRELLRSGCMRAALNLTHINIAQLGQGASRIHKPSKNTPRSLQLWLTRFAILIRIKEFDSLVKEAEAFGDLNKADMFYQFYPEIYDNKTGSMAPFSLRLLIAEVPGHGGRHEESMDRLYAMLDVIRRMLSNLNDGKTEDGSEMLTSEEDKMESIKLWIGRQTRVQHSLVNSAISMKDYRLAANILQSLKDDAPTVAHKRGLASGLCRMNLLSGNVTEAEVQLQEAIELRSQTCPIPDVREYVDLGLIDVANKRYQKAYDNFTSAAEQDPTNIMVANNQSICLLYLGHLKESIMVLQKAINANPDRGLNESLLINLCTLYELESSKAHDKKLNLLKMLNKHKTDNIPNVAECLKLG